MPKNSSITPTLLSALLLSVAPFATAAPAPDFADWAALIPGQPAEEDPDIDGFTSFEEYAFGAEPEDALDPDKNGQRPYLVLGDGSASLKLDFKGRRDVVYIIEGIVDNSPWVGLAWKAGNTPWLALAPDAIVSETEESLVFDLDSDSDTRLYRVRLESDKSMALKPQAARFLRQATFGPTREEIEALAASDLDFESWIDAQMELPATLHFPAVEAHPDPFPMGRRHSKIVAWYHAALRGEDQLRQRVAWALAQILVIGENGSRENNKPNQLANYYDIFVRNAFGNYRDILQEVTVSPKMGDYLTLVNNRKANATTQPDENYAREVMQLFTIGLWQLNLDGTLKLDEEENAIPTYDNDDITELARVFTGFIYAPRRMEDGELVTNRIDDMAINENRHDRDEKRLPDGTILPANQDLLPEINAALDWLFEQPNTAPFISIRLIQRLTVSNPSPGYVRRVAEVFENDSNDVRGNLAAVVKAILLDPEARSGAYLVDPTRGKLVEPVLRFTAYCRAFPLQSSHQSGLLLIQDLKDYLAQSPYQSPTVFNFYSPFYAPQGEFADQDLVAPEFEILDDSSGLRMFFVMNRLIEDGIVTPISNTSRSNPRGQLDTSYEESIASDAEALVDHLDLLLASGAANPEEKAAIAAAVQEISDTDPEARVTRALSLFSIAPSTSILK